MHICVVTPDYPDSERTAYFFVKNLIDAWADIPNVKISVIAPFNITRNRKMFHKIEKQHSANGKEIVIYRPNYFSFSNITICGIHLTGLMFNRAVVRALKQISQHIDIIYGHFWSSAYAAFPYALKNDIPLFVATGESDISKQFHETDQKEIKKFNEYVKGVICVSTKNKLESIRLNLTGDAKCEIFPNAINNSIFKTLSKEECRLRLQIKKDKFVVAFIGWFIERKGSKRLSDALTLLNNDNIQAIFIGEGPETPQYKNTIFSGTLKHDELPMYLNAADVFVLPTLKEGCCNAIIEAMACGLPIISSDMDFNHDILDEKNSILINPLDVNEISFSIDCLYRDRKKLSEMSTNSLEKAKLLTIQYRAEKIHEFIQEKFNLAANSQQ